MGDEPEIGGMSGDSLCAVAAEMKRALHRVGRDDVFIMYNDGPSSVRFREGLCRGLDYFSIDSYDSGAAEAKEVAGLYKRSLVPKLRGPNKWERGGQGLWFVPGLYATCSGPVVPIPRYPFGNQSLNRSEPTCKGGGLGKSPADVLAKMEAFWKFALDPSYAIVGINPWHWQDRPTMTPAMFRRGARSMGPQLLTLMANIATAVRNRTHSHPVALKTDSTQVPTQVQKSRQVGCWWYHEIPKYTNRTLDSLVPGTCTFVDIGSACVFEIQPNGSLSTVAACVAQTEAIVADALRARRIIPTLQFRWVLQASNPNFMAILESSESSSRLVREMASWAKEHKDVADGWTLDYETHYNGNQSHAVHGLTNFLAGIKAQTGHGINWWGSLYEFKNVADVAAVQPYIDFLETGDYYNDLGSYNSKLGWNPHIFELQDIVELIEVYGYSKEQVLLGVGLSAYSYMDIPAVVLSQCAYDGYLGCCPSCVGSVPPHGVYAANARSHSSVGGNGHYAYLWDETQADVAAGRAVQGRSNCTRGHYGPLSSYWIFYPNVSDAGRTGELTFWNAFHDMDVFTRTVRELGYAGVFTWVATSDAMDWRVHKHLHSQLNAIKMDDDEGDNTFDITQISNTRLRRTKKGNVVDGKPTVTVVHSLLKIRPDNIISASAVITSIAAARREYESFQIAVAAATGVVVGVDCVFAGIKPEGVLVHRQHFLNITTQSDCDGDIGQWPDALVPVVDPFYSETRNALPAAFNVECTRLLFWIDVYVAENVHAGMHSGRITVRFRSGQIVAVPVSLRVYNFSLPPTSRRYVTSYKCPQRTILQGKYLDKVPANISTAERLLLQRQYVDLGLMHRVSFSDFLRAGPNRMMSALTSGNTSAGGANWSAVERAWGPYLSGTVRLPFGLQGTRPTAIELPAANYPGPATIPVNRTLIDELWHETGCPATVPEWAYVYWGSCFNFGVSDMITYCQQSLAGLNTTSAKMCGTAHRCAEQPAPNIKHSPVNNSAAILYWQQAAAHARRSGWLKRVFDFTCDEPSADLARYSDCRARASALHEADREIRSMITTEKPSADRANISNMIDIWTPLLNFMDSDRMLDCPYPNWTVGNRREDYTSLVGNTTWIPPHQDVPKSLWWYISCMSEHCASGVEPGGKMHPRVGSAPGCDPADSCVHKTWPSYNYDRHKGGGKSGGLVDELQI
jgi:hypothetical protein